MTQRTDQQIAGVRVVAEAALKSADAARNEARILHEDTMKAIQTVAEGVAGLHGQIDCRFDEYHRDLTNRHIAPLEASATHHERRITTLEQREAALQDA